MNNKPNFNKGMRKDSIQLMTRYGVITYKALEILGIKYPKLWMQQTFNKLKTEGIFTTQKFKDVYNHFVFNDYKNLSIEIKNIATEEERNFYKENLEPDLYIRQTEKHNSRLIRATRVGEILCMMDVLGIKIKDSSLEDSPHLFYLSKVLKRYTGFAHDKKKISEDEYIQTYTRIIGILKISSEYYSIFNCQNQSLEWSKDGETKMNIHLMKIATDIEGKLTRVQNGILFGYSLDLLYKILTEEKNEYKFSSILDVYPNLYYIPYSTDGYKTMQVLMRPYWERELRKNLLDTVIVPSNVQVECDRYDEETDTYTILFCIPNIKRIKNFLIHARIINNKQQFIIVCFSYQKELVLKLSNGFCRIQSIKIDDYLNLISDKGEII